MTDSDPYLVLGLSADATPEQIRAAFRRAARQHHPDTATGTTDDSAVREAIDAYRLLSDLNAKAAQDAGQDRRRPPAPQNPMRTASGRPRWVGKAQRILGCPMCQGEGFLQTYSTCSACRGRAEITDLSRRRAIVYRCRVCLGRGRVRSTHECPTCRGPGTVSDQVNL